jgi:Spy/CpxP family protein refolding chaperone
MNSIRNLLTVTLFTGGAALTAAAGMSLASAADEATAAAQPPASPGAFEGHRHGGPWHLLGKLGLSAAQKQQIKDIMTAAHPQMQTLHQQMRANSLKLRQTKPTDPNYANVAAQVSQTHGTLSAQAMTQRAELRAQVFKVLTPAQQTQLATLEAETPAHKHGGRRGPDTGAIPPAGE